MQLIARERLAHWYKWDETNHCAKAFYEMPKKDGKGTKTPNINDARELGLLWSVTRVLDCIKKPALEAWKIEQGIMAALTLPRQPNESLDAFARRVAADMDSQSDTAKSFGSRLHKQIEQELSGQLEIPDFECAEHLAAVRAWLNLHCEEVHATEIVVGDRGLGVAGKLDLDCTVKDVGRCIIDFKTQRVKNGRPTFYEEWPLQLAAYRHCLQVELYGKGCAPAHNKNPLRIVSAVIDSGPTPNVYSNVWPDDIDYLGLFKGLLNYCCYTNNHDPRKALE